ncbi:MAG: sugar phosphate isomerase/epimerase family protein [Thermoplasmatota archaeon]
MEFTFLPEWSTDRPPIGRTAADWDNCPKPSYDDLIDTLEEIPTPTVHINRDVGDMLCSEYEEMVERGKDTLENNLAAAEEMGSKVAVIHLWDTRAEHLDIEQLWKDVEAIAERYDQISIAVENVPISAERYDVEKAWTTLDDLMSEGHGFTLDLNWCSFYDNFSELKAFRDRILNVHLQGYVLEENDESTLKPRKGELDILRALEKFCKEGYDGYVTLEMNKVQGLEDFRAALELMKEHS